MSTATEQQSNVAQEVILHTYRKGNYKIYCYFNGKEPAFASEKWTYYHVIALTECGSIIKEKTCTSPSYGREDISTPYIIEELQQIFFRGDKGFQLIWVEEPDQHPGVQQAREAFQRKLQEDTEAKLKKLGI